MSSHDPIPAKGGRPTSEISQKMGDDILDAARQVFAVTGYERASMDQVARQAHVSKRTIYTRFGSKADLFTAVFSKLGHAQIDALERLALPQAPPREVFLYLARALVDLSLAPEIVALERMTVEMSQEFPELLAARATLSQRMIAIIAGHISGLPRETPASSEALDREAVIFLSMTLLPGLHRALRHEERREADEEAHLMRAVEIFLSGYAFASLA